MATNVINPRALCYNIGKAYTYPIDTAAPTLEKVDREYVAVRLTPTGLRLTSSELPSQSPTGIVFSISEDGKYATVVVSGQYIVEAKNVAIDAGDFVATNAGIVSSISQTGASVVAKHTLGQVLDKVDTGASGYSASATYFVRVDLKGAL